MAATGLTGRRAGCLPVRHTFAMIDLSSMLLAKQVLRKTGIDR
jgi:hypothetical protein